jgi:hypothetical protein
VLIGSLLVPLGALDRKPVKEGGPPHHERVSFGMLQVAKKDLERLRHLRQLLPRMTDEELPVRVARGLPHRPAFADALTWLDIFGDSPETVERWQQARIHRAHAPAEESGEAADIQPGTEPPCPRKRRRRRRRGGRGRGPQPPS